jgi:hypothetical protein
VTVDPEPTPQPHEAIHAIERDMLDLAIEPGRALARRLFGPSKQNPAPDDAPAADG